MKRALLVAALLALFAGSQVLGLLVQVVVAMIFCLSFWLLMAQGGMVSFGHAVYSGAGAFAGIHLMQAIGEGWPLPMALVPLAGAGAAALLAWPLGWLATRHHASTAFAMITLGTGELVWAASQMFPSVFGGEAGLVADRGRGLSWEPDWSRWPALYLLALACLALALGIVRAYTRTPTGALLLAVRENPERVLHLGQDPRRIRHLTFVLAAFVAGLAGGLGALFNEIVSTEVWSSQRSAAVLIFTLMGGLALMRGALVGGVLMVLCTVLLSGWTPAWLLYLGLAFVGVLWLVPGGLAPGLPGLMQSLRRQPSRLLAAALAVTGLTLLVEMAYQWRMADTLGPHRSYLGWQLDTREPAHWLVGSLLIALALGYMAWQRRSRQGAGR